MKRHTKIAAAFLLILLLGVPAWAFDLGGIFKPPPQEEPKQQDSGTQQDDQKSQQGGGGLLGILEDTGVVDKKTSRIIRGAGQTIQALQPIAYEEERAIGGSLALEVLNRFGGVYENPQLQTYVTLVGQSVASVSDRPDIPYHFAIIDTEEPNAFATPGGYVFISVGLLKSLRNEAQLAGVLGHEVAHITHRHALQTLERSNTLKGISSLSTAIMDKDPAMFDQILDQVSEVLFTRGLDKNLEFEADQVGTEYAYRVGYHPGGLMDFLKILGKRTGHDSIFFSTHPSPKERFVKLYRDREQFQDLPTPQVLAQRFTLRTQEHLK